MFVFVYRTPSYVGARLKGTVAITLVYRAHVLLSVVNYAGSKSLPSVKESDL